MRSSFVVAVNMPGYFVSIPHYIPLSLFLSFNSVTQSSSPTCSGTLVPRIPIAASSREEVTHELNQPQHSHVHSERLVTGIFVGVRKPTHAL